jgi:hypothetical protein
VARQNYQHGKRQRDLAKKQKREEKLQQRLERKKNPLGAPVEGSPDQPVDPDQPVGLLDDEDKEDDEDDEDDEQDDDQAGGEARES